MGHFKMRVYTHRFYYRTRWHQQQREAEKSLKLNERYSDADWHVAENTKAHHTDEYIRTDKSLVLRRGQAFKFTTRLNRPFDASNDVIKLDLRYGERPSLMSGTHIVVGIDSKKWTLSVDASDASNPIVTVTSPPQAMIGRYQVAIYLESTVDGVTEHALDEEPDFILLCNPWCQEDSVFVESDEWRNEYVLNDMGAIWRGTTRSSSPCYWNFGQFEEGILDATLKVLMKDKRINATKGEQKMRDPVWLGRILSAAANSSDENGILMGNWSGDYSGGVSPVTWNGSVKIIQQFIETGQPVKFGQCWVFSGLLTTLMRAIGIPCRSVTNFASAHDTDNTMTIDAYVDENNEDIEEHNSDSCWNFHVWNEIFITGKGHWPSKYAGWAAIDSTPQESSNGLMQCGPAPLAAIKEGHIYIGYDTGFVFGEVNADRVTWICKRSGRTIFIKSMGQRYTRSVGYNISTKSVGSDERHVLDGDYKHPEQSEAEREAWQTAFNFSDRPDYLAEFLDVEEEGKVVTIDISLNPTVPQNGKQFCVNVNVRNVSAEDITVDVNSVLHSCFYTGRKHKFITQDVQKDQTIKANSGESFKFDVPFETYNACAADDHMSMKCSAVVKINQSQKSFCDFIEFQMTNPSSVNIEFDQEQATIGEAINATISFVNPLPRPLTNVTITIEGPGLVAPTTQNLNGSIPPHGKATIDVQITPTRAGTKRLLVDIDATEQKDFKGEKEIYVS